MFAISCDFCYKSRCKLLFCVSLNLRNIGAYGVFHLFPVLVIREHLQSLNNHRNGCYHKRPCTVEIVILRISVYLIAACYLCYCVSVYLHLDRECTVIAFDFRYYCICYCFVDCCHIFTFVSIITMQIYIYFNK